MPISTDQIKQFEEWIAKGKTKDVLKDLLLIRDKTNYQSEIILLANKLKNLDEQEMANAISFSDHTVEQGKLNSSVLLLLAYLKNEPQKGGKEDIPGLSSPKGEAAILSSKDQMKLWFRKYFPAIISCLLTGIVVALVAYQWHMTEYIRNCDNGGNNMNGQWNVKWSGGGKTLYGKAGIDQNSCYRNFSVNCQFALEDGGEDLFTFDSKIGGYHGNQIYFVYENSYGEKGVCSGELLEDSIASFYVKCIDLVIGADTSNGSTGLMYFSTDEIKKEE